MTFPPEMLQKNFTFPSQFQPFRPENVRFLALVTSSAGVSVPPQFLPFSERRKDSKFEPCSLHGAATISDLCQ